MELYKKLIFSHPKIVQFIPPQYEKGIKEYIHTLSPSHFMLNTHLLKYAPKHVLQNETVIIKAILLDASYITQFPNLTWEFALRAAKLNGYVIKYLPEAFCKDLDIAAAAINSNPGVYWDLPVDVQDNPELILRCKYAHAISHICLKKFTDIPALIHACRLDSSNITRINEKYHKQILEHCPEVIQHISPSILNEGDLHTTWLNAVQRKYAVMADVPSKLKHSEEFIRDVYNTCPKALDYISIP